MQICDARNHEHKYPQLYSKIQFTLHSKHTSS